MVAAVRDGTRYFLYPVYTIFIENDGEVLGRWAVLH